ncbi:DUF883 family protein [Oxalobacter formigenes]|jgi:hypothetical protein|uniref:DUF883 domain-containing protein n=1 Tax=Oxalobacter formigenes OXCC13 TaxID=556269 RepID=C3X782_OXAFO|nr:DUF883 family protein [Oxalobacter formigenes]ARQ46930.1 hypothetical protein BRW83_2195 [Oxalobacter formigenes]ARQ78974.1 hypothetical protein BRW84_10385 [Oxalobacter formigenes OXCC13]EEO29058.1 hypothetical protein OFBG_00086 [Oxalobacter formigenes OXCC13]MCZ4063369.1 DUF883 family protein [Oxalobacter formigenes]QDX32437.1 DUF883 domain-containing protein [Oxalobacter formigenes]
MLNTPDPRSQKKLKDGMESVSEQVEVSKEDFVNAASNIKANIQSESERFQEDLKDLKEKVVDLSSTGISVARQTISSNIESAREKANQAAHCAMDHAEKSLESTGQYVKEKPYQALGIALGIGFVLGKLLSRK